MPNQLFDFDRIELWGPDLRLALGDLLPNDADQIIRAANPEFLEDARDALFKMCNKAKVAKRVSSWIKAQDVAGYHGSRLTPDEVQSIHGRGLQPLSAASRVDRLQHILSQHPQWPQVGPRLDETIRLYGDGNHLGNRQGQAHLTVSRAGLVRDFNHYLTHGSEFDQSVVYHLLREEGYDLLASHGAATLFRFRVPGATAFAACNRHFIRPGIPNLVGARKSRKRSTTRGRYCAALRRCWHHDW